MVAFGAVILTSAGAAADKPPSSSDDQGFEAASSHNFGHARPDKGERTIPFWTGQATNPVDGITYSFDIVGADPGTERSASVGVDIVPLNLTVGGRPFNGSDTIAAVLASPLFQRGDYSSAAAATAYGGGRGAGGALSAGNTDVQLLDATMRSQFDKVGSGYHLVLDPVVVHRAVSMDVPAADGVTAASRAGVVYGLVDETWFGPRAMDLLSSLHYLEPHRLTLFVTYDVVLYADHTPTPAHCCTFGAHGAQATSDGRGDSNGKQAVQTFAWASWLTFGFFNPAKTWGEQDISALSHEVVEWANDPFGDTVVQPWFSPTAPMYGCNNLLETGDPTLNISFATGVNTFDQNAFTDGMYHPQDEAFVPWFMRTSPNNVSQESQTSSGGRYTFMGDLNPVGFFHHPPASC